MISLKVLSKRLTSLSLEAPKPQEKAQEIIEPANLLETEQNHVIELNDVLIEKGEVGKFTANMDALLLLRKLQNENRNATKAEKKILAKYVGWGGLASYFKLDIQYSYLQNFVAILRQIPVKESFAQMVEEAVATINNNYQLKSRLFPSWNVRNISPNEARSGFLYVLLEEAEFFNARNSTVNAHYTARDVISQIWAYLVKSGYQGGAVLESSAGIGHFFGLMPMEVRRRSKLFAVELEKISGNLLTKLYPQANIQIANFGEANLPFGKFNLAIGNVPFGARKLTPQDKSFPEITQFALHNYFIAKNLIALAPKGIAILISSNSTLDNASSRDFRLWVEKTQGGNSDFLGAIRLPANAFKENAGTEVTTDILIFRKRDELGKHPLAQGFADTQVLRVAKYVPEERDKDRKDIPATKAIEVNEFYVRNSVFILGEMKLAHEAKVGGLYSHNEQVCEAPQDFDLSLELQKAFGLLYESLGKIFQNIDFEVEQEDVSIIQERIGELVIKNHKIYTVEQLMPHSGKELIEVEGYKDEIKTPTGKAKTLDLAKDFIELKKALKKQLDLEKNA